jgi:hypothetical protein
MGLEVLRRRGYAIGQATRFLTDRCQVVREGPPTADDLAAGRTQHITVTELSCLFRYLAAGGGSVGGGPGQADGIYLCHFANDAAVDDNDRLVFPPGGDSYEIVGFPGEMQQATTRVARLQKFTT